MIDLYTWHTPNGRKVSIMLEEIGMDYNVHSINIAKDEQFQPHFLKVSPNNRIPAIVDKDNNNYSLFESGAILMYLAEKSGKLINKSNSDEYYRTIEWLMWQMGGVGPMFGQVHHFVKYNKKVCLRGRKVLKRGQKAVWCNGQASWSTSIYFR
jgi:GST-like protein